MNNQIVFATNNINKLNEIRNLAPQYLKILSLEDIKCFNDLPEDQDTIEGNALQKASYVYNNYGYNCFADDTGLEIDSLNGRPGVYSARYAGIDCNSENNISKVLLELKDFHNRKAKFRTIISLILDGNKYIFNGECNGEISCKKKGINGFGYDPIFVPEGFDKTFAQMTIYEKGKISHRGLAVSKLIRFLSLNVDYTF